MNLGIGTIEEAEKAIQEICAWIEKQPRHERNESDAVADVRGWCDELLSAADADGMLCGCRLCQS